MSAAVKLAHQFSAADLERQVTALLDDPVNRIRHRGGAPTGEMRPSAVRRLRNLQHALALRQQRQSSRKDQPCL